MEKLINNYIKKINQYWSNRGTRKFYKSICKAQRL